MKELGYPHMISMESFRGPNFELVANCLHWLILRYDPTIDLEINISTEGCRVNFLKSATQLMLARAKIKLNPKNLYSADGYAIKELLKISTLLYLATMSATFRKVDSTEVGQIIKPFNVKAARVLVNEITKCGTTLYDILDTEPKFQETRNKTIMMNTNMDEIEHNMRDAISSMLTNITLEDEELSNVERAEKVLQSKCGKRKLELERTKKRLATLQNVRPTYIDKYEELQVHLHGLFMVYVEKYQNLQWLETQLESHSREEQEKLDEIDRRMRRLQRCIHNEELCILRGEDVDDDVVKNVDSSEDSEGEGNDFWNWFHEGVSKSKRQKDLEALGMITHDKTIRKRPLNWSSWEVYNLDKRTQELPSKVSKKTTTLGDNAGNPHLQQQQLEPFQKEVEENTILDSAENSTGDSEESKNIEEREDDVLDIDGMYDEGLEDETNDDDF